MTTAAAGRPRVGVMRIPDLRYIFDGRFTLRRTQFKLQVACGFVLGFLLPPGQAGFVLGKQLSLFHGFRRWLSDRARSLVV